MFQFYFLIPFYYYINFEISIPLILLCADPHLEIILHKHVRVLKRKQSHFPKLNCNFKPFKPF